MSHSLIGRLLLAFALLWAQQEALSHTLSHLLKASRAISDAAGKPAKPLLKTPSCAQCLTHAQFFSALGNTQRSLVAVKPVSLVLVVPKALDHCMMTVCMFQSRAPPQA